MRPRRKLSSMPRNSSPWKNNRRVSFCRSGPSLFCRKADERRPLISRLRKTKAPGNFGGNRHRGRQSGRLDPIQIDEVANSVVGLAVNDEVDVAWLASEPGTNAR